MATSLLDIGDRKDEVDGIFSQRRPSSNFSYYEIEDCVTNFDPATSKEDFPLHYAVFQGDLNAVQKLITTDNMSSLDTHGELCNILCVVSVSQSERGMGKTRNYRILERNSVPHNFDIIEAG